MSQAESPLLIRKTGVLGAGAMGSRIAAHLANAGLQVVLLDLPARDGPRSGVAAQALEALGKARPAALYDPSFASRIAIGNFEDDLALLADCDWVIEAVTENLGIKQALLEKVAPHLRSDAIVTTNTSGLPVASIAASMPVAIRRRWFGTHFFNPPRYMRLLEIIPTPEADPAVIDAISHFADVQLGKEIVVARDTPNFIANRIGVFIMFEAFRLLESEDLTVEEVDVLTGSVIGWPRMGTFRLADLIGLDVLAHIAANFPGPDAGGLTVPPFVRAMLERRWLGDKTGQGFYRKTKEGRLALNCKALEYRPTATPGLPLVEMAQRAGNLPDRLKQILNGDPRKDKAARFHWRLLSSLWNYSADCLPEIADSAQSVDRAMRAGFNWELGPFELWDAAGVPETIARMKAADEPVSPVAERMAINGAASWYRSSGRECFDPPAGVYRPVWRPEGVARVATFRASNGVVRENPGASLIDLGTGVAAIELHSIKDVIGEDVVRLVTDVLEDGGDAVRNFSAFVISGDSENFSVGGNLVEFLRSAQAGDWAEIVASIKAFQRMTWAIKFCPRPVVAAPFGLCLGGGAEMAMHAVRRQAHAELCVGLVETGVGLLPAGGGCKEVTLHALKAAVPEALQRGFETIAMAKVSASAFEARRLGFVREGDRITMNRERLLGDAKDLALSIAGAGYLPPVPRADIPAPGESVLETLRMGVRILREGGHISDHDAKVAEWVAHVLCGGRITPGTPMTEQYLLDLEREAFLSLCGEQKTRDRISHTLKTGKPLRN
jgi:3-hydroxyacyl-CoA dehydrogenase